MAAASIEIARKTLCWFTLGQSQIAPSRNGPARYLSLWTVCRRGVTARRAPRVREPVPGRQSLIGGGADKSVPLRLPCSNHGTARCLWTVCRIGATARRAPRVCMSAAGRQSPPRAVTDNRALNSRTKNGPAPCPYRTAQCHGRSPRPARAARSFVKNLKCSVRKQN